MSNIFVKKELLPLDCYPDHIGRDSTAKPRHAELWAWYMSNTVCWAVYASSASIQDMGIDHRGAHVFVAQQFLHGADVISGK
jgi:hypothetical protein